MQTQRAGAQPEADQANPGTGGSISFAELARAGNLDALFGLMDLDSDAKNDRLAYQWLTAASDFGHEAAADLIDDVMEVSSMRFDDDQFETAAAHWELAAAYLEGGQGLPIDLDLARKHLGHAFETHDLATINAGTNETYSAEPLIARLTGEARALLEAALAGGPSSATEGREDPEGVASDDGGDGDDPGVGAGDAEAPIVAVDGDDGPNDDDHDDDDDDNG